MTALEVLFSTDQKGRTSLDRMSAQQQAAIRALLEKAGGKKTVCVRRPSRSERPLKPKRPPLSLALDRCQFAWQRRGMKYPVFLSALLIWSTLGLAAKPNVIVILVDDMGYSDAGAFGGEVRTPHVDRLAKGGLRFTQNYNSARCCPSRASLLTGLYSHQAGIANFTGGDRSAKMGPAYRGKLSKQCVTLAEVLKTVGYNTYCVGKWHVGHQESPETRGFDEFYGYTRGHSTSQWQVGNYHRLPAGRKPEFQYKPDDFYATDAFSDYAVEFVKQGQKKKEPFFLYLAHSSPHFPLHAPAKTRDTYLETYRRGWDVLRKERYERQKKSGLVTKTWQFTDLSDVPTDRDDIANGFPGKQNPAWKEVDADRREDLVYRMATFAAMVEHVDRGIGRILSQLEKGGDLGRYAHTLHQRQRGLLRVGSLWLRPAQSNRPDHFAQRRRPSQSGRARDPPFGGQRLVLPQQHPHADVQALQLRRRPVQSVGRPLAEGH